MITKMQAAEQQLDMAIRLFFENIDHLSSYTLAAASREITDDLCAKKKSEIFQAELSRLGGPLEVRLSFRQEMEIFIKDEHYKDAMKLFRARQNFLKHADKDSDSETGDLSVDELALVILFGIQNFRLLEKRLTPAMFIFIQWFGAAKPQILKKPKNISHEFYRIIEGIRKTFHDLYSEETFKVMHELLKEHFQPK
jgi:hypothetical protein